MNEAERNLISGLFNRVRQTEGVYRDPEAEAFINDQVARQPHAPYAMAQTLVVQDQSLQAAQARIAELERQLADARGSGGSFAPGAGGPSPWGPRANEAMGAPPSFGQGNRYDDRQQGYPPPPPPPPQGYPQQPQASGGGGFLSGALQTAAGVAGGALLFEGVRHLFGGGEANASGLGDLSKIGETSTPASADAPTGGWFDGLLDGVGSQPERGGGNDNSSDFGGSDGGSDDGDWT